MVFFQGLDLHTGNAVIQTLELPIPGYSRYTIGEREIYYSSYYTVGRLYDVTAEGHSESQKWSMECRSSSEDLQHQAVWQGWATCHSDILPENSSHVVGRDALIISLMPRGKIIIIILIIIITVANVPVKTQQLLWGCKC
uniref:Uncharacterized protein n=1 Tax=Denticeps clupeoides TaxID=299321 RepID=A0AAY4CE09_9TELE